MDNVISSLSNKLIKKAKSLHKKKNRWKKGYFFVEGVRSVREAIMSTDKIEYILYDESLFSVEEGKELFHMIQKKEYKTYEIKEKISKEICDTENPQGIFAIIRFTINELEDLISSNNNFLIILDRVQDPGNMGTIIRTADAMGANGIVITSGCVDIFNPKTVRATMGSIFHVPICYCEEIQESIHKLKEQGINIISTDLKATSFCYDLDLKKDFALVIGNEANGVSKELMENSNYVTKIPMIGSAESLNVAIASGIIMYEAARQRQNF